MSSREQKLLSLLILIAVLAGALFLYRGVYLPRYQKALNQLELAEQSIKTSEAIASNQDLIASEQSWIERFEPAPQTQQNAQAQLQALCESLAQQASLEIKSQNSLQTISDKNLIYHRARMDILISGKEQSFYSWLNSLDDPQKFQRVTFLRLYPQKSNDTLIEAKVVIEKWFVPQT